MHLYWKRGLTACMAAALLTGAMPALAWEAPSDNNWQAASREGVAARFFVGSDVHIGRNADASAKLTNALNVFNEIDPQADGVLLVGDITNNGASGEYDTLMDLIHASPLSDKVVLAMGNHEFNTFLGAVNRFESKTGQDNNEVRYYRDDDGNLTATVVKLGASNYGGNYTESYDMLKTALETATGENAEAPIIVLGHHGIRDTAYVTNEWYGNYGEGTDKDMVALMEQYPQVIHISGHSHSTLEDARSIYQDDGYTAIQDSTIGAYFENETGKVDPDSGSAATIPPQAEESSQALRIDVMEDGTIDIYRLDLTDGDYMYADEPWTFDANDESDRPYTAARADQSDTPSFSDGAAVTVSSVTKGSAVVHFPAAQAASGENVDMIQAYEVTLTPDNGGSAKTVRVFADYYKDESRQRTDWEVKVTGLEAGVTYTPSVVALTSYEKASAAITGEAFNTANPPYVTPEADVLDVDFNRDQTGGDTNGHDIKIFGQPTLKFDEELGRNVMVFDGQDDGLRYAMSKSDYTELVDGMTVELYYKPLDTKNNNPMGNTQLSGFCFEQKSGTNTVEFWARVGGSYVKPAAQVTKDAWNHLTATFDGSSVKIYLNGELQDTKSASGSITVPPLYLFLGGDTTSGGDLEYAANCEIALARVYTGAMNAEDVKKAYEAATQPAVDPEEGQVSVSVEGPQRVGQNVRAHYSLNLTGDTQNLKTMGLLVTVKGSEEGLFEGQQFTAGTGFTILEDRAVTNEDGSVTHGLVLGCGLSDETAGENPTALDFYIRTAAGKTGDLTVTIDRVDMNEGVTANIDTASVTTAVVNTFDVNADGAVTIDDVTMAQSFYRAAEGGENWEEAKKADVNADGVVDLRDLVEISNAYLDTILPNA